MAKKHKAEEEVELTDDQLAEIAKKAEPEAEPAPMPWVPPDFRNLPPLLLVSEAAKIARLNEKTLYNSCYEGYCPHVRISKNRIRIPTVAFLEWLFRKKPGPPK